MPSSVSESSNQKGAHDLIGTPYTSVDQQIGQESSIVHEFIYQEKAYAMSLSSIASFIEIDPAWLNSREAKDAKTIPHRIFSCIAPRPHNFQSSLSRIVR